MIHCVPSNYLLEYQVSTLDIILVFKIHHRQPHRLLSPVPIGAMDALTYNLVLGQLRDLQECGAAYFGNFVYELEPVPPEHYASWKPPPSGDDITEAEAQADAGEVEVPAASAGGLATAGEDPFTAYGLAPRGRGGVFASSWPVDPTINVMIPAMDEFPAGKEAG